MNREKELHEAVERLYPGSPVRAIKAIADLYGVAISYLDRACFDDLVLDLRGEALADEEWGRIKDFDSSYDNFVEETAGPTGSYVTREFMRDWLDRHGIPGPDGDKWASL